MQRQLSYKDVSQTDIVNSYSEASYEALTEWYKQSTLNSYSSETNNLTVTYNSKHHWCRLSINCLSYLKTELMQLDAGQYELEVFANFSLKDSLICRPFQSQQLPCQYQNNKFITKDPLVLYYHCQQYRDVLIFIEFQLAAGTGPIRLGYCQFDPYQESSLEKQMPIILGWPLDSKHKSVNIGSCFYMHQTSMRTLGRIEHLIPALTIIDTNTKIPCCKNARLPSQKSVQMDTATMIQLDMVRIDGTDLLSLTQELQTLNEKKSKLQAKSIKVIVQRYELSIGVHNTWTIVNQSIVRPLNVMSDRELVDPGPSMNITLYNSKPICLLGILSCKYKVQINSQNLKQTDTKTHQLCWFMFPMELHRQLSLVSLMSLSSAVFGISSFHFKKAVKLTCRIKHPNWMNYRQARSPKHNAMNTTLVFPMEQTKTSKWKSIYRVDKGNAIDDIEVENKKIIRQQQMLQKQLSIKLYRSHLIPAGKRVNIQDVQAMPTAIDVEKVIGKVIVVHIKIESFLPYFKNLQSSHSSDFYWIPRQMQIRFFVLNQVYQSKKLLLPDFVKFGMLCVLTKSDFKAGKCTEATEMIKIELQIKDRKAADRLNRYNLIAIVYDAESKLIYAQGETPLAKVIQIGSNSRLRLELMDKNEKEIHGALCIDVHTTLKQINKSFAVSQQPLSANLITNQLSDKARLQSRIDNFKRNKKLTSVDQQQLKSKQIQLELVMEYKKIKKFARKMAQTTNFKHLQQIECQSCVPSFYVWEYTNVEGSLSNDYKLTIQDSDASILAVQQMHLVRTRPEFEQVCKMLSIQSKYFVESDYKNEFYLKNNEKAKLILKFLTYRIPHTTKDIQPHSIKLTLLRNTLQCAEKQVLIMPSPPDISNVFIFYQVLSDIIELEFDEMFSIRYMNNYVLSISRGSASRWVKNRLVVSINCEAPGVLEFMMVIYKDKTRQLVLNISKVIVYAYQGIQKSLRLGESYQYTFRLSSPKLGIVKLNSTHPDLVVFESPIVSLNTQETVHNLTIFPLSLGRQTIMVSATDYETSDLVAMFIVNLNVAELSNIQRLYHEVLPYCAVKDFITIENVQRVEQIFRIKCTSSQIKFESDEAVVGPRTSRRMRLQVDPQQGLEIFRAYIFIYSGSNLLLKSYELEIVYGDALANTNNLKEAS